MPFPEGRYLVSTQKLRLNQDFVSKVLAKVHETDQPSSDRLQEIIEQSLCFGLFDRNEQIGFARVVTDQFTTATLSEIYLEPDQRTQGLGSWILDCILEHPEVKPLQKLLASPHVPTDFVAARGFKTQPQLHLDLAARAS